MKGLYDKNFKYDEDVRNEGLKRMYQAIDSDAEISLTKDQLANIIFDAGQSCKRGELIKGFDAGYVTLGAVGLGIGGLGILKRWIKRRSLYKRLNSESSEEES